VITHWVAVLLGGVVAVDGTSAGQTMVSRPLVAGLLAGALLGDPAFGIGIGALLELFAIVAVPAGGTRLNELSVATVVAVCVALQLPPSGREPLAIAFALLGAELGGFSVDRLRHWNTYRWQALEGRGITPGRLSALHWSAVAADFVRGGVLVLVLVPLGLWILPMLSVGWPLGPSPTRALILLAIAVHLGALLKNWGGWQHRRVLFFGGILTGLGLGVWL
jgi:mannose/fructose/N-acetylgalactosamine-specific phosphotransferase system component IIC